MNQEIEIEYKNLLSREKYEEMLAYYSQRENITSWKQSNHYFDTPDLQLKKADSALRIRTIEDNRAEITLKTPHEGHLLENNIDLDYDRVARIMSMGQLDLPKPIKELLEKMKIDIHLLKYQVSMVTLRNEWQHLDRTIVLDQSDYAHMRDYELEVEAPTDEAAQETFNEILEQFSIEKRKTPNKIARAFTYLQK